MGTVKIHTVSTNKDFQQRGLHYETVLRKILLNAGFLKLLLSWESSRLSVKVIYPGCG